MKYTQNAKEILLDAIKESDGTIGAICENAGVSRGTYYYAMNKDKEFRRAALQKKREQLEREINAISQKQK